MKFTPQQSAYKTQLREARRTTQDSRSQLTELVVEIKMYIGELQKIQAKPDSARTDRKFGNTLRKISNRSRELREAYLPITSSLMRPEHRKVMKIIRLSKSLIRNQNSERNLTIQEPKLIKSEVPKGMAPIFGLVLGCFKTRLGELYAIPGSVTHWRSWQEKSSQRLEYWSL